MKLNSAFTNFTLIFLSGCTTAPDVAFTVPDAVAKEIISVIAESKDGATSGGLLKFKNIICDGSNERHLPSQTVRVVIPKPEAGSNLVDGNKTIKEYIASARKFLKSRFFEFASSNNFTYSKWYNRPLQPNHFKFKEVEPSKIDSVIGNIRLSGQYQFGLIKISDSSPIVYLYPAPSSYRNPSPPDIFGLQDGIVGIDQPGEPVRLILLHEGDSATVFTYADLMILHDGFTPGSTKSWSDYVAKNTTWTESIQADGSIIYSLKLGMSDFCENGRPTRDTIIP